MDSEESSIITTSSGEYISESENSEYESGTDIGTDIVYIPYTNAEDVRSNKTDYIAMHKYAYGEVIFEPKVENPRKIFGCKITSIIDECNVPYLTSLIMGLYSLDTFRSSVLSYNSMEQLYKSYKIHGQSPEETLIVMKTSVTYKLKEIFTQLSYEQSPNIEELLYALNAHNNELFIENECIDEVPILNCIMEILNEQCKITSDIINIEYLEEPRVALMDMMQIELSLEQCKTIYYNILTPEQRNKYIEYFDKKNVYRIRTIERFIELSIKNTSQQLNYSRDNSHPLIIIFDRDSQKNNDFPLTESINIISKCYQLKSFIVKSGDNYIIYILSTKNKWKSIIDGKIDDVDFDEIKYERGYILFYDYDNEQEYHRSIYTTYQPFSYED